MSMEIEIMHQQQTLTACRGVTHVVSVWIQILTLTLLISKKWILQDTNATRVTCDFGRIFRSKFFCSSHHPHCIAVRSPGPLKRFASWALEFSQQAMAGGCEDCEDVALNHAVALVNMPLLHKINID